MISPGGEISHHLFFLFLFCFPFRTAVRYFLILFSCERCDGKEMECKLTMIFREWKELHFKKSKQRSDIALPCHLLSTILCCNDIELWSAFLAVFCRYSFLSLSLSSPYFFQDSLWFLYVSLLNYRPIIFILSLSLSLLPLLPPFWPDRSDIGGEACESTYFRMGYFLLRSSI